MKKTMISFLLMLTAFISAIHSSQVRIEEQQRRTE